jgi:hypothetical protein
MEFRVVWDVAPCSFVGVDRRFKGVYCFIIRAMMEAVSPSEPTDYSTLN